MVFFIMKASKVILEFWDHTKVHWGRFPFSAIQKIVLVYGSKKCAQLISSTVMTYPEISDSDLLRNISK